MEVARAIFVRRLQAAFMTEPPEPKHISRLSGRKLTTHFS